MGISERKHKTNRFSAAAVLLAALLLTGCGAQKQEEPAVDLPSAAVTQTPEQTPAEPAEEIPVEETPAEETPAEETPAEEAPVYEEPEGEVPVEDLPVESMPEPEPEEEIVEEPTGIPTETPYLTFLYPQEWEGKVEALSGKAGGNTTLAFQTVVGEKTVVLFALIMGPEEADGYLLGHLDVGEAEPIKVYSLMTELVPTDWTEEQFTELNAMQERVNDLIAQLHEDERFVPNR